MIKANLVFNDAVVSNEALNRQTDLLTGAFEQACITDTDVIAIYLPNCPSLIEAIAASMLYGNNYCPINYRLTPAEVSYLLRDSEARVIVTCNEGYEKIKAVVPNEMTVILADQERGQITRTHTYYKLNHSEVAPRTAPALPRSRYLGTHMPYTSGTTGKPKGIVRAKKQRADISASPGLIAGALGIEGAGVALMPAPLHHSATNSYVQQALLYSSTLILMDRFDAEKVLQLIEKYGVTTAYLVPTMYKRMLDLPQASKEKYDLSSLQFVASTGSACPAPVKRQMIEWLGPVIHESYASSEMGLVTLINATESAKKPGSAGKPLGNAQIRIRANGIWAQAGQSGLIYARQPAYADFTYKNNHDARQSMEYDGLLTVGDIGYLDDEGYLYVTDRQSDMVISGGANIYPAEIEQLIHQRQDIEDTAVFGIPDEEFGESLICLLQMKAGRTLDKDEFIQFLRTHLAGYKIPKKIGVVDKLPREETGKLFKKKLQHSLANTPVTYL
ncbi:AMP-binding protein [Advenella sp. FME57]|uniref:AMP-binding protein n=1 Tax=Advenella sp. FME57 TaxID=2742604 RepID=UPI001866DF56|nr:AMP-binding protein [Advenella sp. FME57]